MIHRTDVKSGWKIWVLGICIRPAKRFGMKAWRDEKYGIYIMSGAEGEKSLLHRKYKYEYLFNRGTVLLYVS
jgi:hypothetical protein